MLFAVFFLTGATTNFTSGRTPKKDPPPPAKPAVAEPVEPEPKPVPGTETVAVAVPGTGTVPGTDVPVSGTDVPVSTDVSPEPAPIPEPKTETPPSVISSPEGARDPAPQNEISRPPGLEMTAAVPAAPVPLPETLLLDDALPEGAAPDGAWIWDDSNFSAGKLSHGHPPGEGVQSHGATLPKPLPVTAQEMITQECWLDPANPPKGIALQFRLSSGDEVGVYWEGEEEVFKPQEGQELWYYGPLPELGQWAKLEILAEDMGLEEAQVTGIRFVTHGGRVLWDRTALTAAPPIEEARDILEPPTGVRPNMGDARSP